MQAFNDIAVKLSKRPLKLFSIREGLEEKEFQAHWRLSMCVDRCATMIASGGALDILAGLYVFSQVGFHRFRGTLNQNHH